MRKANVEVPRKMPDMQEMSSFHSHQSAYEGGAEIECLQSI